MTEPRKVSPEVQLIRHTPDPEEAVASAAKLCYAADPDTIFGQKEEKTGGFVKKLKSLGHMSPMEHVVFTFYVQGVSRACTHQLVRHRMASYSQRSQRYVKHDSFDYVMPPRLAGKKVTLDGTKHDASEYYHETMKILAERYRKLNEALGNVGETSNEDARYVLPNACETKIFITVNARELLHIFEERLCNRAQWEIREIAKQMLTIVKNVCPAIFEGSGPKCIRLGTCPEGRFSCGKLKYMIEQYAR